MFLACSQLEVLPTFKESSRMHDVKDVAPMSRPHLTAQFRPSRSLQLTGWLRLHRAVTNQHESLDTLEVQILETRKKMLPPVSSIAGIDLLLNYRFWWSRIRGLPMKYAERYVVRSGCMSGLWPTEDSRGCTLPLPLFVVVSVLHAFLLAALGPISANVMGCLLHQFQQA